MSLYAVIVPGFLLHFILEQGLKSLNYSELAIYVYPNNSDFHHSDWVFGASRTNRPTRRVARLGLPDINSISPGFEHIKSIISKLETIFLIGSALVDVSLRLYMTFILFRNISIFPGTIRPRCTTMPWTIWPALAVLWGVCWMFYPPHAANGQTRQSGTYHHENETSRGESKFCSLHIQGMHFQQNFRSNF